jgi:carboxymethylenebutenolidase
MAAGSDVQVPRLAGEPFRAHLALPDGPGPHPGVVVIHEAFGLNTDIRRIAQRFADSGYAAIAPDLYDRSGARPICIAKTFMTLRDGRGPAFDDIEAARTYLAGRPEVDGTRLGITGFCLGGGFALLSAVRGPYRASAPYYGEVPKRAAELEGICPVVAGFGGRDAQFAPKGRLLERHLTTLGVPHDVKIYPDAGHSYMSPHEPTLLLRLARALPIHAEYSEAAAEDSWRRMLAFFREHLGAPSAA